jgi:hypothetical protein
VPPEKISLLESSGHQNPPRGEPSRTSLRLHRYKLISEAEPESFDLLYPGGDGQEGGRGGTLDKIRSHGQKEVGDPGEGCKG